MTGRILTGFWLAIMVLALSACMPATLTPPVSTAEPGEAPVSGEALAGTAWQLASFGPADAPEPVLAGAPITLEFKPDGQAGGSGGCNSYGGAYQVQDSTLSFGSIIATERACADNALTQQEQRYFEALAAAGRYELAAGGLTVWYDDERGVLNFVHPSETPASTSSAQPTPTETGLPAGWRMYTVAGGRYTFACPDDWEVELPEPANPPSGPPTVRLYAPAARFSGGNPFAIAYSRHTIRPGLDLAEWHRQVFLASQYGFLPPSEILSVERLPAPDPGEQALLVTELAGPEPGWHRHHVYLTRGVLVLELQSEVTPEMSPRTGRALRDIAATVRFLPGALAQPTAAPGEPGLAEIVATATALASITPTPVCDLACRDATAWATITPGPMQTYPPAMQTREQQYLEMLSTTTAQALTTTPTPLPSATPSPTPQPAGQPGLVLYEGQAPPGPEGLVHSFQLAYDPDGWQLTGELGTDILDHRRIVDCRLVLRPGGRGVGGPLVIERRTLAETDWRTTYLIYDGAIIYRPQLEGSGLWFELMVGPRAKSTHLRTCRTAAEKVLETLEIQ